MSCCAPALVNRLDTMDSTNWLRNCLSKNAIIAVGINDLNALLDSTSPLHGCIVKCRTVENRKAPRLAASTSFSAVRLPVMIRQVEPLLTCVVRISIGRSQNLNRAMTS